MGFFSSRYEPGGMHHIRLTDATFDAAIELFSNNEDALDQARAIAKEGDVLRYQARDFPVSEIIGVFFGAYQLRQQELGISEELWIGKTDLGRKEMIEYENFRKRYIEKMELKFERKKEAWDRKGLGGKLFSVATSAAARGIANATTGKSGDVRGFEKNFADYLCGDSPKAKEYLMTFAMEFGGNDEGLIAVAELLRQSYWINEFARSVRI